MGGVRQVSSVDIDAILSAQESNWKKILLYLSDISLIAVNNNSSK